MRAGEEAARAAGAVPSRRQARRCGQAGEGASARASDTRGGRRCARARRCTSWCVWSRTSASLRQRLATRRFARRRAVAAKREGFRIVHVEHPAQPPPPRRGGRRSHGARARDAGVPDLRGEADEPPWRSPSGGGARGRSSAIAITRRSSRAPRQVRNTLAYVMNNWRRHREDRGAFARWSIDPFSTAPSFEGWKERAEPMPASYRPLVVWEPRSWLLAVGWRRHGLIDPRRGAARGYSAYFHARNGASAGSRRRLGDRVLKVRLAR